MFATIALGMGVDLQGVNTIIHYGAPSSIEDYFQGVEGVDEVVLLLAQLCTENQLIAQGGKSCLLCTIGRSMM